MNTDAVTPECKECHGTKRVADHEAMERVSPKAVYLSKACPSCSSLHTGPVTPEYAALRKRVLVELGVSLALLWLKSEGLEKLERMDIQTWDDNDCGMTHEDDGDYTYFDSVAQLFSIDNIESIMATAHLGIEDTPQRHV